MASYYNFTLDTEGRKGMVTEYVCVDMSEFLFFSGDINYSYLVENDNKLLRDVMGLKS